MLNKKEWQLLQLFEANPNVYLTSQELSEQLGFSDKTIRKYVNQLADALLLQGSSIERAQGHGYKLQIEEASRFLSFIEEERQRQQSRADVIDLEEQSDRQRYILNRLFFEEEYVTISELAQLLYVSRTTIANLLTSIRQLLASYHLLLESDRDKKLCIVGKERDKRRFMMEYFFAKRSEVTFASYVGNVFVTKDIRMEELMIIVLDECREARLKLSDYVIHNLVLHLALAIQRLKAGFVLEQFPLSEEIRYSSEYAVALCIIRRIETSLKITFPEEEANYIALHLKVRTAPFSLHDKEEVITKDEMVRQLEERIETFSKVLEVELLGDNVLLNGLYAHFTPLLVRLRNHIKLQNPLLAEIQQRCAMELEVTQQVFSQMPMLQSFNISQDEWAYIALHMMAAIERHYTKQRKRVLVICATGYGSAQMLKNRLETEFGSQMHIVDVISYYEITETSLRGIDMIISSISLATIILPVPVVHVSVFLSEEDIQKIRKHLGVISEKFSAQPSDEKDKSAEATVIFDQIFSAERFIWLASPQQRSPLLRRMVECLQQEGLDFASQMMRQIELRENMGPVVFEEVMAFPHPATPISTQAQVVVAICPKGVYWHEGQQEVRMVCLMSPSKRDNQYLTYVSRTFVKLVQSPERQQQVIGLRNFTEFRQLMIELIEQEINV